VNYKNTKYFNQLVLLNEAMNTINRNKDCLRIVEMRHVHLVYSIALLNTIEYRTVNFYIVLVCCCEKKYIN